MILKGSKVGVIPFSGVVDFASDDKLSTHLDTPGDMEACWFILKDKNGDPGLRHSNSFNRPTTGIIHPC